MLLLLALSAPAAAQTEQEAPFQESEAIDPAGSPGADPTLPDPVAAIPKPPAGLLPVAELTRLEYTPSDRPRPTFVGDTLVIITASGAIDGYDATTGEFRFKLGFPGEQLFSPVAVGEDFLVASSSGKVLRIDAERGTLLDERRLPFAPALPPVAAGASTWVYFAAPEGDVAGFDLAADEGLEAEPRFRVRTAERPAALSLHGDVLIVSGAERTLTALDARTGAPLWERVSRGALSPASFREGGRRVYVGDDLGEFYSLDTKNGNVDFHWSTGASIRSAPIVDDERVYVASLGNNIYAYGAGGGSEQWRAPLPGRPADGGAKFNSQILAATLDGVLIEVDVESGVLGKSFGLPGELGSAPAYRVVEAPEGYFERLEEKIEAAREAQLEAARLAREAAERARDEAVRARARARADATPTSGAEDAASAEVPPPAPNPGEVELPLAPAPAPGEAALETSSDVIDPGAVTPDVPVPVPEEPREPEWYELSRIAVPLRAGTVIVLAHQPPAPAPPPPGDPSLPGPSGVPAEDRTVPNQPPGRP